MTDERSLAQVNAELLRHAEWAGCTANRRDDVVGSFSYAEIASMYGA